MPYLKTSSIGTIAKSKMITAGNVHLHPYVRVPLLDFTLSNARRFYSSMENPSGSSERVYNLKVHSKALSFL